MPSVKPIKTAVILAAGLGEKLWPYNRVRPKAMIPIANRPVISSVVEKLDAAGVEKIIVAAGPFEGQLRGLFRSHGNVTVVGAGHTSGRGTAETLSAVEDNVVENLSEREQFAIFYGDTLPTQDTVKQFLSTDSKGAAAVLLRNPASGELKDSVCALFQESTGEVTEFIGRSRGDFAGNSVSSSGIPVAEGKTVDGVPCGRLLPTIPCGFILSKDIFSYLQYNPGLFTNVEVGMMPPAESYLEMSLELMVRDGKEIFGVVADAPVFDIDRPWDILRANEWMVRAVCTGAPGVGQIGENSSIDETASIEGNVTLGRGSIIGRNVIINGNVVIGDNTVVENGALILGNAVIGDNCYIGNYCRLAGACSVGNKSVVNHCAELEGIIMEGVYLDHYMELYGIVGLHTDIGAATVCGNLRFDDGDTVHRVRGRREQPAEHANAAYIGDFSRTGVNATIMPGCKTGCYSIVGPGVLLDKDLPEKTCLYVKQELESKPWGPEQYGW
jgi:UDP-N-acetylglucosamine diphosphorylase / glucose-1-phosphate thymidylyltransferase / UDP-N-acetylgalactosamine diphosphorylase / glucosamine-1-phosphate N-acetyltransferase / galactosamine-1-phosphate N-acetyltransferase